ncbi:MAG TPA: OB-fold domain-containing protein [Acidimicrobiales bacterium]|nr:OB-fold domain-containing protein [Acidimicrobiales bacterium]
MTEDVSQDVLSAKHVVEYPYTRSVGPVLGRFFSALREGRIEGVRGDDGRVLVPPAEYDPQSGRPTGEAVAVSDAGVVETWCWVAEPLEHHLLARPFAFALIKLDGADSSMLHIVDAYRLDAMSTGMRVRATWRAERSGRITDIACFVPEAPLTGRAVRGESGAPEHGAGGELGPVRVIESPIRLEYTVTAGRAQTRFLRGLIDGKFLGERCPRCQKVYVPPRGSCPTDGVATEEVVECAQQGTVTTFCIVNVPFRGQAIQIPYVCAQVLLDGADIPFMALLQEVEAGEVRMGMRVEAVWAPPADRGPSLESLRWFRPNGEPDASFETFRQHL